MWCTCVRARACVRRVSTCVLVSMVWFRCSTLIMFLIVALAKNVRKYLKDTDTVQRELFKLFACITCDGRALKLSDCTLNILDLF